MNYEMLHLESLIEKRLKSKSTKNIDSEILREFERLSILFLRTSVFHSRKQNKIFIQGHQHRLIHLLESVLTSDEDPTTDADHIIKQGCQLIHALMREFPKAFNFKTVVSPALSRFLNPEITLNALIARKKLAESTGYSQEFRHTLSEAITIDKQNSEMVTLETLSYLSVLIKLLTQAIDANKSEKELLEMLISLNFNKPEFLTYCLEQINPVTDNEKLTDTMIRLIHIRKEIQQIIPQGSGRYLKTQPGTYDFLTRYLDREIKYLYNLSKVIKNFQQASFLDSRFKVSLSVKQLALFIQLQVSCGIILEEKPKFIHNYIISHYSTSTTERISEKSFKNSYYVHSGEDVQKIIQALSKMISKAKGYI